MIKSVSKKATISLEDMNQIIKEDLLSLNSKNLETVKSIIQKYVTEIIISFSYINIKIALRDSNIAKGINVVEARRVELLSNNPFILISPSAVCYLFFPVLFH